MAEFGYRYHEDEAQPKVWDTGTFMPVPPKQTYTKIMEINGKVLWQDDETGIVVADVTAYEFNFLKLGGINND